jgi:hypothetical protein
MHTCNWFLHSHRVHICMHAYVCVCVYIYTHTERERHAREYIDVPAHARLKGVLAGGNIVYVHILLISEHVDDKSPGRKCAVHVCMYACIHEHSDDL